MSISKRRLIALGCSILMCFNHLPVVSYAEEPAEIPDAEPAENAEGETTESIEEPIPAEEVLPITEEIPLEVTEEEETVQSEESEEITAETPEEFDPVETPEEGEAPESEVIPDTLEVTPVPEVQEEVAEETPEENDAEFTEEASGTAEPIEEYEEEATSDGKSEEAATEGTAETEILETEIIEEYQVESGDFIYTNNNDGSITITRYSGTAAELVIPGNIDGKTVTSIGDSAFRGCISLQSVEIPESVTNIGNYAFQRCTNLQSISIPESVTTIGTYAFIDCSNLQSITIPESITTIPRYAFSNCINLSTLIVPAGLKAVNIDAINNCTKLKTAGPIGSGANVQFGSITEMSEAYGRLFKYAESIEIPESVTTIGDSAFSGCSNLQSITIPESVISIGMFAFYNCANLQNIIIPDSVTGIGDDAFNNCTNLQSITISDNITYIGERVLNNCTNLSTLIVPAGLKTVYYDAINNCTKLKTAGPIGSRANVQFGSITELSVAYGRLFKYIESIEIPESVTTIGTSAFSGCSNLQSITIPESVISIGDVAFSGCSNLQSVTIPKGISISQNNVFYNCTKLKTAGPVGSEANIQFGNVTEMSEAFSGLFKFVESIEIPESVTTIGNYAFSSCSNLQSITIPDSVTTIGNYAFTDCSNLQSITIPESVTTIGHYAFQRCTNLQSITIPESITSIPGYAFYDCASLQSITIPESVTTIGNSAFEKCAGLQSIVIPNSVTSIQDDAFKDCTGLSSITISNRITTISAKMLYGCSSLQSITIPDSVTSIYPQAFANCTSLQSVAIPESVNFMGVRVFNNCTSLQSITLPNSIFDINDSMFEGCTSLQRITIPEGVWKIGNSAFSGCSSLATLVLPVVLDTVGNDATHNCVNLKTVGPIGSQANIQIGNITSLPSSYNELFKNAESIEIPSSVTSIGEYEFSYCTKLSTLIIPGKLSSVGENVVNGCRKLKTAGPLGSDTNIQFGNITELSDVYKNLFMYVENMTIPDDVTSIGGSALSNCSSLQSLMIPNTVTAIGNEAFSGCTNLSALVVPAKLNSVGENAVTGCENLKTAGLIGSDANIQFGNISVLPSAYNHLFTYLESIDIPDSVADIEAGVFEGTPLTSIDWPEAITNIKENMFSESMLNFITIPATVTSVSEGAFNQLQNGQLTVEYLGSEAQWNAMTIADRNDALLNADVHYVQTVQTWNDLQNQINAAGDGVIVRLAEDITGTAEDSALMVESGKAVTIDLAGHTVRRELTEPSETGSIFDVSGTLTVENGVVTGGKITGNGGGFNVVNGSLTLNGVTVQGNESTNGGGIYCADGTVYLIDSTVTDNVGNGIAVEGTSSLYVEGNVKVTNNTKDNKPENIHLASTDSVITVQGALGDTALLGVTALSKPTADQPVVITSGLSGNGTPEMFSSDEGYFIAQTGSGEIALELQRNTVTFKGNGGTFYEGTENATTDDQLVQVTEGKTVSEQIPELSLNGELPVGYTKDEETIVLTEDEVITFVPEKDTVFTAVWDQPVYTWEKTEEGYTVTAYFENLPGNEERADAVLIESVPATCETDGSEHYSVQFSNVLYTEQTNEVALPALGHDYGEAEYTWIETKTGYTVTASAVCKHDESHILTETAEASYQVITEPACETEGLGRYTAVFEDEHFTEQTKDIAIPAIGHNYEFKEIIWSGDDETGYTAEGSYVCANDSDHRQTITAEITSETTDPACEEAGQTVYTAVIPAVASADEQEHTETKTVVIEALGHDYGEAEYIWAETETGYTATASAVCKHDESHILTETAEAVYEVITEPACETEGLGRYTAVFENEHLANQTKDVVIPAIGHNYEFKEFIWSGDDETGYTAEGSYVCANDADHRQTITAEITSETTDPACEEAGQTVYTAVIPAVASADEQEHTETKTVVIEALGHDYGEAEYIWTETETGYTVTASAVCKHDESHILAETAEAGYQVITEPACETEGLGRYTAVFEDEHFTEQIKDVEIPESGHNYEFKEFVWSGDDETGYTAEGSYVCANDSDHKQTIAAEMTSETADPACEEAGQTVYTAVIPAVSSADEQEHTETKTVVIEALGHDYGEAEFTWTETENGYTVTASAVCKHDESHILTETATAAYEVITEPAYGKEGLGRYTAVFEDEHFTEQTKDVEIPAEERGTGLYLVDGTWQYYENGVFTAATGLVQRPDNKKWFYVKDGIYTKATGLTQRVDNGKWYYVQNGAYTKVTGVVRRIDNGKWFYVKDGVYTKATGLAQRPDNKQWYYVQNGAYYNKITGLVQRIDNGKWFYVENGVYKKVTGLVQRPDNKKWYYVANGAYTKATGLTQRVDNKKWYYVYNGAYTKWTGVTGRITDGKMFYVANGVYTKYTGTAKDAAGNTYKVTNGAAVRI